MLLRPFEPYAAESAIEKNTALCRIGFGLVLFHHYADIVGFSLLGGRPLDHFTGATLGLLVALGAATPLALLGLLDFQAFPRTPGYLGSQVAVLVTLGLLLGGAGRTRGVDAVLFRPGPLGRAPRVLVMGLLPVGLLLASVPIVARAEGHRIDRGLIVLAVCGVLLLLASVRRLRATDAAKPGLVGRSLYVLAPERPAASAAPLRFLMIVLFWGITAGAMAFHFSDPLWLGGKVLQLVMTTPYLTDHYELFTALRDRSPGAYDVFFTLALLVQSAWELFLPFLIAWRWGRLFAAAQGLLFFLFSLVFLNLGYLPLHELCWWLLAFGPGAPGRGFAEDAKEPVLAPPGGLPRRTLLVLVGTVTALAVVHLAVNRAGSGECPGPRADRGRAKPGRPRTASSGRGR